jgi:hypothetical protein
MPVCGLYWDCVVSSVSKHKCRKIMKVSVDKPSIVSGWATLLVAEAVWHHRLRWHWLRTWKGRRSLGERQSRSGRFGEEKNLLRLSDSIPGPYPNRCTENDVQTSLIQGSVSQDSACIIRDSNPANLHPGCEAYPGWSAAARFGVHQYVCQRDLVTIGNEPATPICEHTAPTGLSEPRRCWKRQSE